MSYLREKLPEFSPAVVVEPWRKALMDAAELIRVRGLCQDGRFENLAGEVCAWGALTRVSGGHATAHALAALTRRVGHIPYWNDRRGRTKEDVIATLEAVAQS